MYRARDLVIRTQAAAVAALLLTVVACSTNPATGKQQVSLIGEQQEIQIGRHSDQEIVQQMGLYPDDDLQRYVQTVGQRLAGKQQKAWVQLTPAQQAQHGDESMFEQLSTEMALLEAHVGRELYAV